jgi:hypothetical protein
MMLPMSWVCYVVEMLGGSLELSCPRAEVELSFVKQGDHLTLILVHVKALLASAHIREHQIRAVAKDYPTSQI